MLPIEQSCYWLAAREPAPVVSLDLDSEADIAIVGAGLTGLWTALFLKELSPSTDVIIAEAEIAGYGGSGRNAGMLSETVDHSHALAIEHFGEKEARKLALLGQKNIDDMGAWLAQRNINCELEPTGRMTVALSETQLEDCRRSVAIAERLGVTNHRLMSADEVRAELDSPLYLGGVLVKGGGILNPVKLVDGLRGEAERAGVRVFEKTAVSSIQPSRIGVTLQSARARLKARRVVLATNAYSHHLCPRLLRRFIPLYDYILVSDPLENSQLAAIGWHHRQGVTDGRSFFNYYRLTRDNRILWGTGEATYYRGNQVDSTHDHSPAHYQDLRVSFRRHFPRLGTLDFPYSWGGPIAATTRLTPFFGSLEKGRILYGLGYTGHGLGNTRLAGEVLAHLALERSTALTRLPLVTRKPFPYPPEPLRHLAVGAVTRALRRVDQGRRPSPLLRFLDALGIGFSS